MSLPKTNFLGQSWVRHCKISGDVANAALRLTHIQNPGKEVNNSLNKLSEPTSFVHVESSQTDVWSPVGATMCVHVESSKTGVWSPVGAYYVCACGVQ